MYLDNVNHSAYSLSLLDPHNKSIDFIVQELKDRMSRVESKTMLQGDAAYLLICSALVFLMTPGLGYFYSGMARSKNALSLIFICFLSMAVVLLQWTLFGFSLALSAHGSFFLGDLTYAGGHLIDSHFLIPSAHTVTFFIYQGMFAGITPALIFGSSAERVRVLPALLFIFVWTTVVYDPIAYWTWGQHGWLNKMGSLDFAGGTPVHIASGFAGLAKALVLGKRIDLDTAGKEWEPSSLSNVLLGTGILWFGWFGFNGGPALGASARAAMATTVTSIAAAAGGLTWIFFDYRRKKKLSALGFCCGSVAALVSITPASGFVGPWAALVIGVCGGLFCNLGCRLKYLLGYDDALDVFGTHGIGGFLGNMLTGVFAQQWIGTLDDKNFDGGWIDGNWMQVPYQLVGSVAGAVWSFVITFLLVWLMQIIPGLALRLNEENEALGVDVTQMGETAFTLTYVLRSARKRLGNSFKNGDFSRHKVVNNSAKSNYTRHSDSIQENKTDPSSLSINSSKSQRF